MKALLWVGAAIAVAVYICNPLQDPDLWWHVTVGRWIIAHADIPTVDIWGRFSAGSPWRAYSWSIEIAFAAVERWFGLRGLMVAQIVLAAGLALSMCFVLSKIANDWFMGALLGLYATVACFNHFTLRPQAFVWVYCSWLLLVAQQHEDPRRPRHYWHFAVIMMLWANTHLSSVLGILAVVCWLWGARDSAGRRTVFPATLYSIFGTLLTPYLGGEWFTLFHKSGHPFRFRTISEFVPANIMQYSTIFLLLLLTFLVLLLPRDSLRRMGGRIFGLGCFVLGSLAVVKFLPFAVIYAAGLVAAGWCEGRGRLGNIEEGIRRLQGLVDRVAGVGLVFVVLVLIVTSVYSLVQNPLDQTVTPKTAVDFIEAHKLPHPIINTFGQGGYLMYRFSAPDGTPKYLVSIDGRTNLIADDVWAKYFEANHGGIKWKEYFELTTPRTVLWRSDSPLLAILEASGNWCEVFRQDPGIAAHVVLVSREEFQSRKGGLVSRNCSLVENTAILSAEGVKLP